MITLVGRGGIGKTSLALATLSQVTKLDRFEAIVWFSARDIDLHETGPKPVRPDVLTQKDVSDFFATLVSPPERNEKEFSSVDYIQKALGNSPIGPTLFVFDNFETTTNPGELYSWIDTYIRNPNKVLITTRLRDFKGDYPVEIGGMTEDQCRELITQTGGSLGISHLLRDLYISTLITESQGHPYVLKVLLGEVAKEKREVDVRRLVAGSEEILIALFERTYGALNEAARRVFLTLSSWNSAIPQIALEAILLRPENERSDIGEAIDSLVKSSMVEVIDPGNGEPQSLNLPLVAREFGRKKLNVSPMRTAIFADREILQMLGVDQSGSSGQIALHSRLERFVQSIATSVDDGVGRFEDYRPILEMIARNHNPTWLLIARFYEEIGDSQNLERAKEAYRRFLENDAQSSEAASTWRQLAYLAYQTGDVGEELNAFVERSQVPGLDFSELSNTVNRFNEALHRGDLHLSKDERRIIGQRLLKALEGRKAEASGEDFSRLAWLALNLDDSEKAAEFVKEGIARGGTSFHLQKLQKRLGI